MSEYHNMLMLDGIGMLFLDDVDVAVCWWVFFVNMCHRWRFQISDQSDIREHLIYHAMISYC